MKFTSATLAAVLAHTAYSHTTISYVLVNDVDQGMHANPHGLGATPGMGAQGYIRVPYNNDPIWNITSPAMTCNVNNTIAPATVKLAAGDKFTVQWHHDFDTDADDIIDGTHKGPIDTYIAPEGLGDGPVWVKIAETGYDATKKMWAVDMLKAQKGRWDIVIPPTLAPGDYLIRQEVVALHQASVPWNGMTGSSTAQGVQLYMGCVQITVATGGTTALPAGVAIPGVYTAKDLIWDLKTQKPENYVIPGPALWSEAAKSAVTTTSAKTATSGKKTSGKRVSSARFRRESSE